MQIRNLMTAPAVTVSPETSIRDVAALLSARHISGVPVVDHGQVVGVVSESDIVENELCSDEPSGGLLRRWIVRSPAVDPRATTASEAMTSPALVVDAWMSDYYAAWLMSEHDVNRLPVVDRGKLVGVIARADLVRHFARSDAEIAKDIRERVIDPLDVRDVVPSVDRGRVILEGELDLEDDLDRLPHAVSQVPGVVSVETRVAVRERLSN
jgi:predicted transcriptional regulator